MARNRITESKRPIDSYEHRDKQRANNPPVGLVTPENDPDAGTKKTYAYDPHLDPQLVWAGKAEHTSFVVPTVSLHVHERIDSRTIVEALRKRNSSGAAQQLLLFEIQRKEPLRQAIEFYNTKTGGIESGGADKIAVWLLDTDYDGRSLYPRQVFFPMAGPDEGWAKLARNLKAEIDENLIEAYRGTVSLPFEPGEHKRIAVKIVDDRGIESLKVLGVESTLRENQ